MESKIALTERLRREGRWAEASKLKDEAIKEAKKAGMKSDEAKDAGWDAMEKAYPPLPSTAEPEHGDDETEEKAAGRAVGPIRCRSPGVSFPTRPHSRSRWNGYTRTAFSSSKSESAGHPGSIGIEPASRPQATGR